MTVAIVSGPATADTGPVVSVAPSGDAKSSDGAAFDEAAETGTPVELVSERTETETVFANPSGTYSREIANAPIRVKQDGDWTPVDLDLVVTADGVKPKASPDPVVFSDGGLDPLVVHTLDDVKTSISWPTVLPKPTIDGSSLTYPDVLVGVDLKMTVTDGGVSQVLIVHDAEAAKNPALKTLHLLTDVDGGTIQESDGGFKIVADGGEVVGNAAQPAIWDSAGTAVGIDTKPLPDASPQAIELRSDGPVAGDDVDPIALKVTGDELTLTPPPSELTGSDVKFPLYIDPTAGASAFQWAMVFKENPNSKFYKWTDSIGQGVGHQDYNGVSTKRLFFQYNIPAIQNSQIITATFKARMVWSASCTDRSIQAWRSGAADSATTWNDQPVWTKYASSVSESAGWSGCNPNGKDMVWNIKTITQDAVDEERPTLAIGLRSPSETDPLTWRRFLHTASILVEYNRAPATPTGVTIDNKTCTGATPVELGPMTNAPILRAKVTDPDTGDLISGNVKWSTGYPVSGALSFSTSAVASGSIASKALPIAKVGDNMPQGDWSFGVRGQDGDGLVSGYAATCYFKITGTPATPIMNGGPDPALWVADMTYPIEFAPGPVVSDTPTVGYRYTIDNEVASTTPILPVTGPNSTRLENFSLPAGSHTIRVWAYSSANTPSAPYVIDVEVN